MFCYPSWSFILRIFEFIIIFLFSFYLFFFFFLPFLRQDKINSYDHLILLRRKNICLLILILDFWIFNFFENFSPNFLFYKKIVVFQDLVSLSLESRFFPCFKWKGETYFFLRTFLRLFFYVALIFFFRWTYTKSKCALNTTHTHIKSKTN